MTNELCPHGVISGGYCEPCAEKEWSETSNYQPPRAFAGPFYEGGKKIYEGTHSGDNDTQFGDRQSGLDAPYYDWPETIRCAQDLIEYLGLNFSQGNILKSLVRENNPNAKKTTTALYEAEKRYFYSKRDLRHVRSQGAGWGGDECDAEERPTQVSKT